MYVGRIENTINRCRGSGKTCSGWSKRGRSWEASSARRRTSTCNLSRTSRLAGCCCRSLFLFFVAVAAIVCFVPVSLSPSSHVVMSCAESDTTMRKSSVFHRHGYSGHGKHAAIGTHAALGGCANNILRDPEISVNPRGLVRISGSRSPFVAVDQARFLTVKEDSQPTIEEKPNIFKMFAKLLPRWSCCRCCCLHTKQRSGLYPEHHHPAHQTEEKKIVFPTHCVRRTIKCDD